AHQTPPPAPAHSSTVTPAIARRVCFSFNFAIVVSFFAGYFAGLPPTLFFTHSLGGLDWSFHAKTSDSGGDSLLLVFFVPEGGIPALMSWKNRVASTSSIRFAILRKSPPSTAPGMFNWGPWRPSGEPRTDIPLNHALWRSVSPSLFTTSMSSSRTRVQSIR